MSRLPSWWPLCLLLMAFFTTRDTGAQPSGHSPSHASSPSASEVIRRAAALKDPSQEDRIAALGKSLESQYGVRPLRYFGYLDEERERALAEAILEGTRRANQNRHGVSVDPAFVHTVAMGEGLNSWMENNYYQGRRDWIDAFSFVGLDMFMYEEKTLKSLGFLRKDFKGYTADSREDINERGQRLKTVIFNSLPHAMEALAATLAYRRWLFLRDAREVWGDEKVRALTEAEINFWTYVYFNAGAGYGKRKLQSEGMRFMRRWTGPPRLQNGSSRNARYNAMLRLATWEWLSKSGIFLAREAASAARPDSAGSGPGILDRLDAASGAVSGD